MKAHAPTPAAPGDRRAPNLLEMTQRALWPLVKLLLHRGVGYPAFAEALKSLFVRVVTEEFPLHGKRETDSRISVLTGIYRRDVRRLRDEAQRAIERWRPKTAAAGRTLSATLVPEPPAVSLSSMVIAVWTGKPPYIDKAGNPKPLVRTAAKGGRISFEALVRSVNKDVRPRALLDEWLRRGAVTLDAENRVCLNLDSFMAHKTLDDKAFYFAQNVHDHMAAVTYNLTGGDPPLLERCVHYGKLTEESVAELEQLAREVGMEALQAVNRRAMELQAADVGKPHAIRRMNFGLYFYSASVGATEDWEQLDE